MNSICLIGNLGDVPEYKVLEGGTSLLRMRLATTYRRKDKDDVTDWHTVIVWGNRAEGLNRCSLSKGDKVGVKGRMQYRQWEDKDGNKRTSAEVVAEDITLCGGARRRSTQQPESGYEQGGFADDDIPF